MAKRYVVQSFRFQLKICIAEALYDATSLTSDPTAFSEDERKTLHDRIVANLEG